MDKLLEEDLEFFDLIDQNILNQGSVSDRVDHLKADTLLCEDLDWFDQIDPQKLMSEHDTELTCETDALLDLSTDSTSLNTRAIDFGTPKKYTNTQHLPSQTCTLEPVSSNTPPGEVSPLMVPEYEDNYTISQILKIFD